MPNIPVVAGQTNVTLEVKATDASGDYTGGAWNTATITCKYTREGAAPVTVTLVTQTTSGAHTDGGFVHLHGGLYRLDAPDAAFIAGARRVTFSISGISGVVFQVIACPISGSDPYAAVATDYATTTQVGSVAADVVTAFAAAVSATYTTAGTWGKALNNALTLSFTSTKVNAQVQGMDANTVTASAIATGALTAAKFASDYFTAVLNAILNWEPITGFSLRKTWKVFARLVTRDTTGRQAGELAVTETYVDAVDGEDIVVTYDADNNRTMDISQIT